jgi:hypothetical protein
LSIREGVPIALEYSAPTSASASSNLPYVLVPRTLSREEWEKKYSHAPAAEEKKD